MRESALIFCATPLHCLIAERIVKINPGKSFFAIICLRTTLDKAKITYYGDRLIAMCEGGEYIEDNFYLNNQGQFLEALNVLKYKWKYRKYKTMNIGMVYVSHYSNTVFQIILGLLSSEFRAVTFDDGFVNLTPGIYKLNANKHIGRLYRLLGLMSPESFRPKVVNHYTIYDAENAAFSKPEKISLYSDNDLYKFGAQAEIVSTVRIFLGQPIFEGYSDEALFSNIKVTKRAVEHSKSELYLPHPREAYRIEGLQYIDTPLIFEDYILKQLDNNPGTCYLIFSFFSSSMLNLLGHPRLQFVAYRPDSLPSCWDEPYEVIQRLGIPIIDY